MRNADLFRGALELPDDDRHDPHDTYCAWCDAHETAGEPHRDDCLLRVMPCRGCGSIHCDSECAEFRAWLAVAWLEADTAMRERDAADLADEEVG